MLQNVIENNSKKLTLQLNINQLKKEKVESLQDYLQGFKGDKPLYFNVYDTEKKVKLTLNSKKQKIKITPELLSELDTQEWFYRIN